jgi:hypothetical protein
LEQRAKLIARLGQSLAAVQDARAVHPPKDEDGEELHDIPKHGRSVGEVLVRGNLKEARVLAVVKVLLFIFQISDLVDANTWW